MEINSGFKGLKKIENTEKVTKIQHQRQQWQEQMWRRRGSFNNKLPLLLLSRWRRTIPHAL